MKHRVVKRLTLLVFSALFALLGGENPGQAAPLFSETFDNSGSSLSLNAAGWNAYRGSGAVNIGTAVNANNGAAQGGAGIGGNSGNPQPPAGYLYVSNGTETANQIYGVVQTFTSSLTLSAGDRISWTMGNSDKNGYVQLLIQIGGDGSVGSGTWYASTAKFGTDTSYGGHNETYDSPGFASASTESVTYGLNFSTTASAWRSFTLNPDSSMSIGNQLSSSLPSTNITGIGFYVLPSYLQQSVRLDTLLIVPEPHTAALAAMGLAAFLMRKSRPF